ncbi:type II toxin-antitoxin system VapC family toxin [Parafrigoribacterium humi]|jgi:predicted nucleic acid-binding protein|uniref:type II toxin-antitoxin system VapC family toxin n=1 Tax=Parafrigoribacterium humi TaxID=3144664 RepID=UPI0032EC08A2
MSDPVPPSVGFLIDTNVLLDIATADPIWAEWSAGALAHGIRTGPVYINPLIYAEASVGFSGIDEIDERMPAHILRRAPLPYAAGFLAARAHQAYRRRGGTRVATLPDFYIGAHAVVENLTLVTRDVRRYRTAFPTLRTLSPG